MGQTAYGIGIYTAPEAARMVGMSAQTLRRWLQGYDHGEKGQPTKHEAALWHPQYDVGDDGMLLGFRDLIEARIVLFGRNASGCRPLGSAWTAPVKLLAKIDRSLRCSSKPTERLYSSRLREI